jgi:N4-gp56 family major capsid protein
MNRQFFAEFDKKRYLNLADVTTSTARGTSYTGYRNQKTFFSGQISDAAKAQLVALSAVEEARLAKGNFQYNARYRNLYPDTNAVTFSEGQNDSTTMQEFSTNYKDGVIIEPEQQSVSSLVQWKAEKVNIYDLLRDKQDELSYSLATKVEKYILDGLAAATLATSSTRGASLLFGGDATSEATIAAGDVMTYEKIVDGTVRIGSIQQYYWDSGVEGVSSAVKNPWANEPTDPYVLMIGPEQKASLLKDSQFSNYLQYGGQEPLLNGEIGKISDVKVVVSQYIPRKAAGATTWDASGTASVNLTRCILMKGRAAYTFVWGQEPTFEMDKDIRQTRDVLVLWTMYAGSVVHNDAICFITVANK